VRKTLLVTIVGAVAVVAVIVASGTTRSSNERRAPALPAEVVQPPRATLATLRGRPAAVVFWASWCGPCRKEAPGLARLATRLGTRARLVAVDWSDNAGDARTFVQHYGWRFPVLRDGDGTVGNRYGISGLPTTFILDAQGRIVRQLRGPQTAADIEAALAHS
jgi:thiol-disulfide isomerase/thioredoxin